MVINGICQNAESDFASWAKIHATKIETCEFQNDNSDLEPIVNIVGDAKIICLGESRHDIHEQFALKNRLIVYMIQELNVKTFILEASLPYSEIINNYVITGYGNIDTIMSEMPGWFLWDVEEMKDVLIWIRKYNEKQNGADKVQFFGIDIVAPVFALNKVFDFLEIVDSDYFISIREQDFSKDEIDDNYWPNTFQLYSGFSEDIKEILRENYDNLMSTIENNKDAYIKKSSKKEYELISRYAYCALQANRMFSAKSRLDMGLIRDSAMANNVMWIYNEATNNSKAIIWAHNVHIAKSEFEMTGEESSIKGMGYILKQEFNNDMVSIAATYDQGEYLEWNQSYSLSKPNSIENIFSNLGYDYFILDIRETSHKNEGVEMLNSPQEIRGQGFMMTTILNESYDALYFTKRITRVTPCPISLEKYRNMN